MIAKLNFSIIAPVTWSFRNHSNILICGSKTIYIYIYIYNYIENSWVIFFRFLWWIESSEEQHLCEIEIFCNIINVFIITFDQFKASLLNKSINFYNFLPKNYTDSKLLNSIVHNVTKAFYFRLMLIFGSFYSSTNPEKNILNCFKYWW